MKKEIEKIFVIEFIESLYVGELEMSIDMLIAKLKNFKKTKSKTTKKTFDVVFLANYDREEHEIEVIGQRLETDEEFEKRKLNLLSVFNRKKILEQRKKENNAKKEKELYLKLKEKYE